MVFVLRFLSSYRPLGIQGFVGLTTSGAKVSDPARDSRFIVAGLRLPDLASRTRRPHFKSRNS